jgi:trehalose 6-phosphate synthase/phosphatase
MTKQRVIFVMHQFPFVCKQCGTEFIREANQNHLAQYAGSQALERQFDVLYVGWDPQPKSQEIQERLRKEYQVYAVDIPVGMSQGHYEGYCKSQLWPLFHYILWNGATNGIQENKNWEDYNSVNERFANVIEEVYQEGDVIWIQDYHLMLLPSLLRSRLLKATIGFFLHTPFPSSEIFRCLPKRSEILAGILGASLVGFQTYSHARHFINSCTRVLGCESNPSGIEFHGFNVQIGIFPVGIDLERTESIIHSSTVNEKKRLIRDLFKGKQILIGRDTMDQIKGVEQKLEAFHKFLELYPQWRNQVALVQVSTPHQKPNVDIERKVSEWVHRINGTYGSLEYVPVHHYHHKLDPDEYYALLCVADVALITPLRDGMNTTSHDYIVCQQEKKGTLVLSEFTGTANAMSGAILVNPWDITGVAHAIHDALSRSKDEKEIKYKVEETH